ncbi:MAG: hypothetical protein NVSMB1_13100 [Polyangiales bacterium]
MFSRILLRLLVWVAARLPFAALRAFGVAIAFIAFDVWCIRRRHVIQALARAKLGDVSVAREVYRSLGTGIFELLWLSGHPEADLAKMARIEGWSRFEEAHSLGRGVIVATAHTGNWDLAACLCAARTKLTVVTKRLHAPAVDDIWQTTRSKRGIDLIAAPGGGVFKGLQARLAQGRSIALLVDQDPERRTSVLEAAFLGEVALLDMLPASLAARTRAPIVVAFARRERALENGKRPAVGHVVEVVDVIVPPADAGEAWITETTRCIAISLERFVRTHPSSWLWMHRRWKTRKRN